MPQQQPANRNNNNAAQEVRRVRPQPPCRPPVCRNLLPHHRQNVRQQNRWETYVPFTIRQDPQCSSSSMSNVCSTSKPSFVSPNQLGWFNKFCYKLLIKRFLLIVKVYLVTSATSLLNKCYHTGHMNSNNNNATNLMNRTYPAFYQSERSDRTVNKTLSGQLKVSY